MLPQLLHGTFCEYHLFASYSAIRRLNWQLSGRWTVRNNFGYKKPSPWNSINVYHWFISHVGQNKQWCLVQNNSHGGNPRCTLPWAETRDEPLKTWEAILPTVSLINVLQYNSGELYSTATDPRATVNGPQTENDHQNGPQMILDRKWSPLSTANDPERKIREWPGLKLLVHRVTFIIATKRINSTELI